MVLLTQTEVLEAVTGLTGEYAVPIRQEIRATARTHATPPSKAADMEGKGVHPPSRDVPPKQTYPGSDYLDEHTMDMGLDSREELRHLEDY